MARHIYSRESWGARDPRPVEFGNRPLHEAFLHHSDDLHPERFDHLDAQRAHMREIQNFHMDDRNWSDFAYHFAIFQPVPATGIRIARIFRGRGSTDVVPAAQEQHNRHTLAIVVIGDGTKETLHPDTQRAIVWLLGQFPTLERFGGHRNVVATTCPGDKFYAHVADIARRANLGHW